VAPIAQEIPIHTTAINVIDPHLKEQFILTEQGSWKTSHAAGHVLFTKAVHPRSANRFVNYLSGLYGTWGGSIDWQVLIAGTGFNGGKLLLVKTPPYVDASKMTLTEITVFPNIVIDVKAQDSFGLTGVDQRPIAYHQVNIPPQQVSLTTTTKFMDMVSTGGWISLIVLNPLIAANMSTGVVTYSLFSRLGEDFQFSQMVPPKINETVATNLNDTLQQVEVNYFPAYLPMDTMNVSTVTLDNSSCRTDHIDSTATILNPQQAYYDLYSLIGKNLERMPGAGNEYKIVDSGKVGLYFTIRGTTARPVVGTLNVDGREIEVTEYTFGHGFIKFTVKAGFTDKARLAALTLYTYPGNTYPKIRGTGEGEARPVLNSPNGESFVYFNSARGADGEGILQPNVLRDYIFMNQRVLTQEDIVFQITQIQGDRPLRFVRLGRNGMLTSPIPPSMLSFAVNTVYLKYFGTVSPGSVLPDQSPSMERNEEAYILTQRVQRLLEVNRPLLDDSTDTPYTSDAENEIELRSPVQLRDGSTQSIDA